MGNFTCSVCKIFPIQRHTYIPTNIIYGSNVKEKYEDILGTPESGQRQVSVQQTKCQTHLFDLCYKKDKANLKKKNKLNLGQVPFYMSTFRYFLVNNLYRSIGELLLQGKLLLDGFETIVTRHGINVQIYTTLKCEHFIVYTRMCNFFLPS